MSECDGEASIMRRSWPTIGCWTLGGGGWGTWKDVIATLSYFMVISQDLPGWPQDALAFDFNCLIL